MYGPDNQPLYSWRVLILPYISQDELYREFHLDEPWDSEHNIKLLERMPVTYAAPGSKKSRIPAYHTVCHVFVGPGTAFDGPNGIEMGDFPDGTSNTLLIVEAGDPVPWTKPEEIAFTPDAELTCLAFFTTASGLAWRMDPYASSERTLIKQNCEPQSRETGARI